MDEQVDDHESSVLFRLGVTLDHVCCIDGRQDLAPVTMEPIFKFVLV